MPSIIAKSITAGGLLRRMGCAGVVACITGAVSAYVRPMIDGPVHYEMIASLFVLLPITMIGLVLSFRQTPWKRTSGRLVLAVFATCLVFMVGWSLVQRGPLWDDMLGVMVFYAMIAAAGSWVLLVAIQFFRPPVVGPYCPACAYCLIGAPADQCPECGRAFTLAELGVTREDLAPVGITTG